MTHPHLFLHVLIRWMDFTALVAVVGGLSYRQFVLIPMPRGLANYPQRSAKPLILVALFMLSITSVADLIFRALMISNQPLSELFSFLPTVLMKTHFGKVWTWRAGLLIFLLCFWFLKKEQRPWTKGQRVLLLSAAAGVCLTTSLSGHAADLGSLTLTVLADWTHLIAISCWVGGLFALRIHLLRQLALLEGEIRRDCLAAGIERFSTVAVTSVGALIAAGAYNTYVHVHSSTLLIGTSYGRILIVKWALVLPMLALGAVSRYGVLPLLQAHAGRSSRGFLARRVSGWIKPILNNPTPLELERWFFRLIMIEAILGLGVLACSAWMTQLPPPHQISAVMEHSHLPITTDMMWSQ